MTDDTDHNGHTDADRETVAKKQEFDIDDTPERPTKDESTIGRLAGKAIATVPKPLLGIRGTLFKRMAIKSIENYHKTAGGDAIGINARAGQDIALEPVAYKSPAECDEGEQPGWHVKGRDKSWNPGSEGNTVNYLGRTPTVLLDDDAHVEAGWLAPRVGEAVEIGNHRPVFTDPTVKGVLDATPNANGARADGGANMEFELESPGVFSGDNIIDLDSGSGHDGMRISAAKAREWQAENAPSEQMQLQDDRAYMRGLIEAMDDSDELKAFIYAALFALAVIGLVVLGPKILGGGGGGGGLNPLMINAVGALAPL